MFEMVERDYGQLHVLFSHAGTPGPPIDAGEEEVDRFLAVNTKSSNFTTSFGLPLLRKAGQSSLIFTSSAAGITGSARSPLYSYAKGGLIVFAKAIAKSEARNGVRANVICPGHTRTAMTPGFMRETDPEKLEEMVTQLIANIPMGREGRPDDVATVALFLACDDSKFVSGVAIPVDGAMLA